VSKALLDQRGAALAHVLWVEVSLGTSATDGKQCCGSEEEEKADAFHGWRRLIRELMNGKSGLYGCLLLAVSIHFSNEQTICCYYVFFRIACLRPLRINYPPPPRKA
jgi:hypothetical protein